MSIEPWPVLAGALVAGLGLGSIYYLALWYMVQWLPRARSPVMVAMGGMFLRLLLVLGGLYWIGDGHWQRIVVALGGIVIVRMVVVRRFHPKRLSSRKDQPA